MPLLTLVPHPGRAPSTTRWPLFGSKPMRYSEAAMPRNKAKDALTTASTPHGPHWAMLTGLRTHALRILGDGDRDLDDVSLEADAANAASALFLGTWRGLARMAAVVTL